MPSKRNVSQAEQSEFLALVAQSGLMKQHTAADRGVSKLSMLGQILDQQKKTDDGRKLVISQAATQFEIAEAKRTRRDSELQKDATRPDDRADAAYRAAQQRADRRQAQHEYREEISGEWQPTTMPVEITLAYAYTTTQRRVLIMAYNVSVSDHNRAESGSFVVTVESLAGAARLFHLYLQDTGIDSFTRASRRTEVGHYVAHFLHAGLITRAYAHDYLQGLGCSGLLPSSPAELPIMMQPGEWQQELENLENSHARYGDASLGYVEQTTVPREARQPFTAPAPQRRDRYRADNPTGRRPTAPPPEQHLPQFVEPPAGQPAEMDRPGRSLLRRPPA